MGIDINLGHEAARRGIAMNIRAALGNSASNLLVHSDYLESMAEFQELLYCCLR